MDLLRELAAELTKHATVVADGSESDEPGAEPVLASVAHLLLVSQRINDHARSFVSEAMGRPATSQIMIDALRSAGCSVEIRPVPLSPVPGCGYDNCRRARAESAPKEEVPRAN
jgi:hypothetical protein